MKKKNIIFLIGFIMMLLICLWFYPKLPQQIPTHWNAQGKIDSYSAKSFVFMPLAIYLLGWGLIPFTAKIDPKKENYKRFYSVQTLTQTILCFFSVVILAMTLIASYHPKAINANFIMFPLLALLFIVIGNSMPKIKFNYTFGVKTPWTLANETVWYKTHRFSGKVWVICGFVVLAGMFLPSKWILSFLLGVILTSALLPFIYSYLSFQNATQKKGNKKFMIELRHVTKIYSGSHKAVDNINLTIPTGEIIGFIGPNGAGKTTTIKMISGILSPDEGEILINGKNIVTQPLEAKKEFGIVPDNADIFLRLKGIEYLNFMADMYEVDNATRQQRIQELSETFEMQNALNDKILSYSHGMRQKIVIMGVLISDPNVWILDEPMTGLDVMIAD